MGFIRRFLAVVVASVSSVLLVGGTAAGQRGGELDGFEVTHVPAGVGELVTDFPYEWGDVRFTQRAWERQVESGGHQVDLQVFVLRGQKLSSPVALRDFLADYHEHDPGRWQLADFRHDDGNGFIGDTEAFWLVEPGVAVEVRIAPNRFDADELSRTARGVRAVGRV
ncbi:hypothetical protein GCM10012275_24190 [Longimycelium tulufanense]|uniref:Secreted protein n=1 Tax=Longimycelium tulufanense TaxID=907463 RepID=A0A8J3C7Y2_9PSEU|nr:hypothetical protein [Longimycelium tulufanense]GGM52395.1 hypothetical protein GCM10012275_24190 [Longimycelium tulufanense]